MSSMYVTACFFDKHNAEDLKNTLIHVVREVKKLPLKEQLVYEYDKVGFKRLLNFISLMESEADTARKISSYDEDIQLIPDSLMARYYPLARQIDEFFNWDHSYTHQRTLLLYAHTWTMTNNFQRAEPKARFASLCALSDLGSFLASLQKEVYAETINFDDWLMLSRN